MLRHSSVLRPTKLSGNHVSAGSQRSIRWLYRTTSGWLSAWTLSKFKTVTLTFPGSRSWPRPSAKIWTGEVLLLNKGTHLFKEAFVVSHHCHHLSGEAVKFPASCRPWRSSTGPWTSNTHRECAMVQNTWEPLVTLFKMTQTGIKIHLIVLVLFLCILYLLGSDVFGLDESVSTSQAGAPDKTALLHRGQGQMFFFFF